MGAVDRAETVQALRDRIRSMQSASLGVRTLPTDDALRPLLPDGGLKPGAAYATGSTALAMLALAGPSAAGGWCGVVGLPEFGVEAAAGYGIDLARLVLVPQPGEHWLAVAAQLADVLPIVLVAPRQAPAPAEVARLGSRLRQRGAVLVVLGAWPQAEAVLRLESSTWVGLGTGHGCLRGREAVVAVESRGLPVQRHRLRLSDDFLLTRPGPRTTTAVAEPVLGTETAPVLRPVPLPRRAAG